MKRRADSSKGREKEIKITLAGAPNVGKSTVFNALTGMRQHTGNWTGKTVESAKGTFRRDGIKFTVTDIPGTYSLAARSAEEDVAKRYIEDNRDDVTIVVCDASGLARSLPLAMQILKIAPRCVVFLNLCDEAEKSGIEVDAAVLSRKLGAPVIPGAARRRRGIDELIRAAIASSDTDGTTDCRAETGEELIARCDRICSAALLQSGDARRRLLDRITTGKYTAFPLMALLVALVLWITVKGANYPSDALWRLFSLAGGALRGALEFVGAPPVITSLLMDGVFRTASWVVSVMLPPMAIFFPLFTLLEDFGYLPRVAFCLDRACRGCGGCGKQALCMCQGLGCNAVGVTGCRIIDSKRERLVAILTNSFIPCNGRFPALIAISSLFLSGAASSDAVSAAVLTLAVALAVAASLLASKILTKTVLRGVPSSFTLELPPYRAPKIGEVVVRSVFDRTLRVTGRAIAVAAPAGAVIWALAGGGTEGGSLLSAASSALDPVGRLLGLDGVILLSFILGLPAGEIILPLMIMIYSSGGALPEADMGEVFRIFTENGWSVTTAICTMILYLFHSPCSTTLLTIKKETGSIKLTLLAAAAPTALGVLLCAAVNALSSII